MSIEFFVPFVLFVVKNLPCVLCVPWLNPQIPQMNADVFILHLHK